MTMALLSESKPRIHNKRDSSALAEVPTHFIEFEPFDINVKCPLLCHIVSSENNAATLGDLGQLQLELEECLINSMKRTHMLKNEKKVTKPDLKPFKNFDERLKKLKDSNFQFSQGLPKNKPDINIQRCDILENVAKSQNFSSNKNDVESRFWNFILSYEMKASELNPLFDFINSNVPVTAKSGNEAITENELSKREMKDLVNCVKRNYNETETHHSIQDGQRLGPFTQRLLDSFVKSDDDKVEEETFRDLKEKSKRLIPLEASYIEKSLRSDLKKFNFDNASWTRPESEHDSPHRLQRILSLQNHTNECRIETLLDLGERDLARQKVRPLLRSIHLEIIEAYKNLIIAKKNKNSISDAEQQYFERIIAKKESLISYMNGCLPYINQDQAAETKVSNEQLV